MRIFRKNIDDRPALAAKSENHLNICDDLFFRMYDKYIDYVRHENELINQRTTWFVTTQAAFFLILSYLIQKYFEVISKLIDGNKIHQLDPEQKSLVLLFMIFWVIICLTGLISSWFAKSSIMAAILAQQQIVASWTNLFADRAARLGFPALMGGGNLSAAQDGARFARNLPNILFFVWALFIVYALIVLGAKLSFS